MYNRAGVDIYEGAREKPETEILDIDPETTEPVKIEFFIREWEEYRKFRSGGDDAA